MSEIDKHPTTYSPTVDAHDSTSAMKNNMDSCALGISYGAGLRLAAVLFVLVVVPVLMAWAWIHYFSLYLYAIPDFWNLCLALSGVAAGYSLDRIVDLDPRIKDAAIAGLDKSLYCICVLASLLFVLCFWMSAASAWELVLLCALLSLGNWSCKKIPGAKTLFITATWACTCFFLPFAQHPINPPAFASLLLWMVIFAISCIMCDIKDVSFDRLQQIRSLPVVIGVRETRLFIGIVLSVTALVAAWVGYNELAVLSVLLFQINLSKRILDDMLWAPLCIDGCLLLAASVCVFYGA